MREAETQGFGSHIPHPPPPGYFWGKVFTGNEIDKDLMKSFVCLRWPEVGAAAELDASSHNFKDSKRAGVTTPTFFGEDRFCLQMVEEIWAA